MTCFCRSICLLGLLLTSAPGYAAEALPDQHRAETIAQLQASTASIQQRLAALDGELAAATEQAKPEREERDRAEARYEEAKRALQTLPSVANRQRVDSTKFQFFIADNKYQRAARDLEQLAAERQQLRDTIAANERAIAQHQQALARQEQLEAEREEQALQAAARKAARESRLRREKELALREREEELSRARLDQEAAMKEIASLKARLATSKAGARAAPPVAAAAAAPRKPPAAATPAAAPRPRPAAAPTPAPPTVPAATLVRNGKDTYLKLIHAARADDSRTRRLNKILQVVCLTTDRVSRETSHSLRHLGNNLYQGNSILRAGTNEFVIGDQHWSQQIPASADREPFVFMLDNRDARQPRLLLFAQSDLKQ